MSNSYSTYTISFIITWTSEPNKSMNTKLVIEQDCLSIQSSNSL